MPARRGRPQGTNASWPRRHGQDGDSSPNRAPANLICLRSWEPPAPPAFRCTTSGPLRSGRFGRWEAPHARAAPGGRSVAAGPAAGGIGPLLRAHAILAHPHRPVFPSSGERNRAPPRKDRPANKGQTRLQTTVRNRACPTRSLRVRKFGGWMRRCKCTDSPLRTGQPLFRNEPILGPSAPAGTTERPRSAGPLVKALEDPADDESRRFHRRGSALALPTGKTRGPLL